MRGMARSVASREGQREKKSVRNNCQRTLNLRGSLFVCGYAPAAPVSATSFSALSALLTDAAIVCRGLFMTLADARRTFLRQYLKHGCHGRRRGPSKRSLVSFTNGPRALYGYSSRRSPGPSSLARKPWSDPEYPCLSINVGGPSARLPILMRQ
jgi:hypothetical protein